MFGYVAGQALESTMSKTWNGAESGTNSIDPFQIEWSAHLEKNLSDGSYLLPSTANRYMVALRKVKGKYVPYRLTSSYGNGGFYAYTRMNKSIFKKFNSGTITWDSISSLAYFTSEKGNHCGIYTADRLSGKKKATILPFQYNNKAFSVAWPSISPDGQQLYFASDMPGGAGGWDIYVCQRKGSEWTPPQSLGGNVNSPADERYPYISEKGVLYFSSNRKESRAGSFDIYQFTEANGTTAMPYPINSVFDDLAISMQDSAYRADNGISGKPVFVLTNRPKSDSADGGGLSVIRFHRNTLVRCTLEHKRRMHPLVGFNIEITDEYGQKFESRTDSAGQFSFLKEPGRTYNLKMTYPGMDTVESSGRYSLTDNKVFLIDNYRYWEVNLFVTHKRSKSPLHRARVRVIENQVPVDTFYTDDKGKLQLDLNRDHAYQLLIDREGFQQLKYTPPKPRWNKYVQNFDAQMPEMRLTLVEGKVRNPENQPAQGVQIEVFKGFSKVDLSEALLSDPEGEFELFLPRNNEYTFVGRRNNEVGAFTVSTDQYTRRNWQDTLNMDMKLVELRTGEVFTTFLYEGDPILLQAGRYPQMTEMLRYLQAIPGLKIELGVHTDTKKGGQASWRDGKNAADFAADYFYINDIARDRVKTKSFGRSKPVTNCQTCSEADHQSNRRVEIRILEN